MLQLKTPLSSTESEILVKCLSDMEQSLRDKAPTSNKSFAKRTALTSAREKVQLQVYDCFYHEEITNMVYALDSLSRKCSEKLTGNLSEDEATVVGDTLRTAAIARTKLRHATTAK